MTVFVDNVNEAGEATLSTDQPLIGQAITASVSDPGQRRHYCHLAVGEGKTTADAMA